MSGEVEAQHVFVTVGAQMAFDRLVHAVDRWAATTEREVEVFAQIGPSDDPPTHVPHVASMGPADFAERMAWADVVVSHAGMGTIISALVDGTPLVLLPRLGARQETRNDHQVATVARFADRDGVTAVDDENALVEVLEAGRWSRPASISTEASPELISTIRDFIDA